jgi:tetratricopeptide (TPR) repeat protein/CHAT domain-containing protein
LAFLFAVCPLSGAGEETGSQKIEEPAVVGPAETEAAARVAVADLEGGSAADLAEALDHLVELLIAGDRAAEPETIEFAGRAVDLRRAAGGEPADLASSLTLLGETLSSKGDLEAAAAALTEAEGLIRDLAGAQLEFGRTLNRLAAVRTAQGSLSVAVRLYAAALAALEPLTTPGHGERDRALEGLGRNSYVIRDLGGARSAFEQLLDERVAVLGADDAGAGSVLSLLARVDIAEGDLETAEERLRRSIGILERAFGRDDIEVAFVINDLARVVKRQGDYLEALQLTERALAIFEISMGSEHPYVAGLLNNLGGLLSELGDLAAARQAHERALAIREINPGPDSAEVAQSLSNLGAVVATEGNPDLAVTLLERALAIRERGLGPEAREVGLTLLNLGWALDESHDLDRAGPVLERAIAILKRYPPNASNVADALNNLALVLLQQDRGEEAAEALEQARAIYEETRGHYNPRTASMIANQAKAAAFGSRVDAALGLALESVRIGREHLQLTAAGLSQREALEYAGEQAERLDLALSLAVEPALNDPTLIAAAWDALIRARGLVLDEMAGRRLITASTPAVAPLAEDLQRAAGHLSGHLIEGHRSGSDEEIRIARQELERAERALGEASLPFARFQTRSGLGLDEVVSSLPAGTALIAFARFDRRFTQDPRRRLESPEPWYLAFVRTPSGGLDVLPLAEASTIDRLVIDWRAAVSRPAYGEEASRQAGNRLRAAIWDPVAAAFGRADRVILVPDGELGLLNFAALPTGIDTFLVEQGPLLVVAGLERDLVPDPSANDAGPCLLAFGDPDFNTALDGSADAPPGSADPNPQSAVGSLSGVRFVQLPGTAEETATVAALWAGTEDGFEVLRLTGSEASEGAFKALAPGFRVLHLATHGFFLGSGSSSPAGSTRGVGALIAAGNGPPKTWKEDTLQLSGLAMAGANQRDLPGDEDGVLTAEEIAALDLSGVEWAVLSACDSGVGEVSVREGIFGLQRAFRIAGARTVIMSLWAVDDEAAREWMAALYRAHLIDGLATAEAVRRASLDMLAARRSRGASLHPSSWAPFVASGDGR